MPTMRPFTIVWTKMISMLTGRQLQSHQRGAELLACSSGRLPARVDVAGRHFRDNAVFDLTHVEWKVDLVLDSVLLLAGPARLAHRSGNVGQSIERRCDLRRVVHGPGLLHGS